MANHRKKHPRSRFLTVRVTAYEKNKLEEIAMELNLDFSTWVRRQLGLREISE